MIRGLVKKCEVSECDSEKCQLSFNPNHKISVGEHFIVAFFVQVGEFTSVFKVEIFLSDNVLRQKVLHLDVLN